MREQKIEIISYTKSTLQHCKFSFGDRNHDTVIAVVDVIGNACNNTADVKCLYIVPIIRRKTIPSKNCNRLNTDNTKPKQVYFQFYISVEFRLALPLVI